MSVPIQLTSFIGRERDLAEKEKKWLKFRVTFIWVQPGCS